MTDIKEIKLVDVKNNSNIINKLNSIYKKVLSKRDIDNWYIFNKPFQNKLIEKNDGPFKKALDRYKYHVRFKEDSYESYQNQVSKFLFEYDIILNDKNFLINDHISLADIAIFPFNEWGPIGTTFAILTFFPYIAVTARRLHDSNYSGWLQLLVITIIGIIPILIWLIQKGQDDENRFGVNPLNY